jgi:hypothetical protein
MPIEKSSPVPESATVYGLPGALSERVSVPVLLPPWVGVNVMLIVQLASAPTLGPHVFVWVKSPLVATLEIASAELPRLVRVTCWDALVALTTSGPKARLLGESSVADWSSPKTPTPLVVPTKTLPLAMVGVMNLLPDPN